METLLLVDRRLARKGLNGRSVDIMHRGEPMGRPPALPEGVVERIVSYMGRDWFLPLPERGAMDQAVSYMSRRLFRPSEEEEAAASAAGPSCDECGVRGVTLQQCSGCRAAHYCSRLCQSQAWPKHKKRCKKSIRQRKGAAKLKREEAVACGGGAMSASPAIMTDAPASGVSGCVYLLAALLVAVIAVSFS